MVVREEVEVGLGWIEERFGVKWGGRNGYVSVMEVIWGRREMLMEWEE